MSLNLPEYLKINQSHIGKRVLLRQNGSILVNEYLVLEISPSNEYVKLTNPNNTFTDGGWSELDRYNIEEILPDIKIKRKK